MDKKENVFELLSQYSAEEVCAITAAVLRNKANESCRAMRQREIRKLAIELSNVNLSNELLNLTKRGIQ